MKQVTQNYKNGSIHLAEVEWPALKPGGVLVRTRHSVVSIGTEGMKVREGQLSYFGKARARPDQLRKVLDTVRQQGILAAYQKVMNRLDTLTPLGYSLAGEVLAVGRGAEEFRVGQRVACAGAGYANHAEINFVPKNLVVPIPDAVPLKHAAFATVGSIALQGFRQAELQLGESACVIGLGLLGQLLVQILCAAGVRVIGVDLLEERCRLAERLGAKFAATPRDADFDARVARLSGGHGADCIFIAAGAGNNTATELAVRIARDRARIVDIGKAKIDLPWNECYLKELDVRFSRSYGPGRYDPTYEEQGIDYPIGYVRWTERRNLSAFLNLVADAKVQIEPLLSAEYAFDEAERLYEEIGSGARDFIGVVLNYTDGEVTRPPARRVSAAARTVGGQVRVGLIGAGNYACSMLMPHLATDPRVELAAVATTSSLSAQNAVRKFAFRSATTDYRELLDAPDIDVLLIATRHASHARLVAEGLRAGKTVYVEKPLGITLEDLALIEEAIQDSGNNRLMVGFNRRFAPMIQAIATRFGVSTVPRVGHYRVHAGQLEQGSWYLDASEGTRFTGEAGHFFDVLACLIGSRPIAVTASVLRPSEATADDLENMAVIVRYENGSLGNLLYLTQGGRQLPKEYIELFGAGTTAQMENFEMVRFFEASARRRKSMKVDKGQKSMLDAFVQAVYAGTSMPIPIDSLLETTMTTLAVEESLRTGQEVLLRDLCSQRLHGNQ